MVVHGERTVGISQVEYKLSYMYNWESDLCRASRVGMLEVACL